MPEDNRTDLLEILRLFHDSGARFVVIGGIAMNLHGSAYMTYDVDVSYARDRANCDALAISLRPHRPRPRGFPDDVPFVLDAQTLHNASVLTLATELGVVDLLAEPAGTDSFEGLWARAMEMEVDNFTLRVASLEDLIAMKRAANRPKDQLHVMELLALQRLTESDKPGSV